MIAAIPAPTNEPEPADINELLRRVAHERKIARGATAAGDFGSAQLHLTEAGRLLVAYQKRLCA